MEENKEEYYSIGNIIVFIKSFFNYLRRKWLLLMITALAGAGLGVIYWFIQKPKYEAVTTFILEEKSTGGSGLAGLASQFGLNLGSLSSGGSIFAGDNILDILKSKKVVQQVLLSQVDNTVPGSKTLGDYYLLFTGIKKKWKKNPLLSDISFVNTKNKMSPIQDSVLNFIYETIIKKNLVTERTRKQSNIIKVRLIAPDRLFARLMTERLIEEAGKLYLDIRTGTAQENIRQLQRRSDSLLLLLNNKSYSAAASQLLDINPGIRSAIVPTEIAIRDKTVLATLYAEVTKNLEISKLLLSQQTPVIQLLDRPEYLLDDNKKGLAFLLIVFSFAACFMYIVGAFFLFLVFDIRDKQVNTGSRH